MTAIRMLAAVYNPLWGLYAAVDPQWLFRFAGMTPINQPAIFACVGMVVARTATVRLLTRPSQKSWLPSPVEPIGRHGRSQPDRLVVV